MLSRGRRARHRHRCHAGLSLPPGRIEIASGTTIVWTNNGQVCTFPFHCTPHPFMPGVIEVH